MKISTERYAVIDIEHRITYDDPTEGRFVSSRPERIITTQHTNIPLPIDSAQGWLTVDPNQRLLITHAALEVRDDQQNKLTGFDDDPGRKHTLPFGERVRIAPPMPEPLPSPLPFRQTYQTYDPSLVGLYGDTATVIFRNGLAVSVGEKTIRIPLPDFLLDL